jgi:peptidoglycan/LPS O-acetylase OafA/YrhL
LGAAFTVFLAHAAQYWKPDAVGPMQVVAHHAVIVFFVLSGYVIAFTVTGKCNHARDYAIARLSRLYSVVVPALVLTAVLWVVGSWIDPGFYHEYLRRGLWLRYLATGLHLNELWFMELNPLTNSPFWSLGYEAWYYVIFGVAWFVRPWKIRVIVLILCALVVGPKVLLLMPAWLIGVAIFFWRDRLPLGRGMATTGFVVSLTATVAVMCWLPNWPQKPGTHPLYLSGAAISDFITSVGWAATIWCFHRAFGQVSVSEPLYRVVRWCANHTFSLYLYHAPVVIFATALVPPLGMGLLAGLGVMATILLVVMVLGAVTEAQRLHWQKLFGWAWDRLSADREPMAARQV